MHANSPDTAWFKSKLRTAGVTLRDAARRMNLDPSALSRALSGKRGLKIEEAHALATVLGADLAEVFDRIGRNTRSGLAETSARFEHEPPSRRSGMPSSQHGVVSKSVTKKSPPPAATHPIAHPAFGVWKGLVTLDPKYDYTQPADPDWGKVYDD